MYKHILKLNQLIAKSQNDKTIVQTPLFSLRVFETFQAVNRAFASEYAKKLEYCNSLYLIDKAEGQILEFRDMSTASEFTALMEIRRLSAIHGETNVGSK